MADNKEAKKKKQTPGLRWVEEVLCDVIRTLGDEEGTVTTGNETTITDNSKNWQDKMWAGATLCIFTAGAIYARRVSSNTNIQLTFSTLPTGVKPEKGDRWILKHGLKTQFAPLEKENQHNVSITANTDILSSDLTPTNTPCLFRIEVCLNAAGVFSAMVTKADSTQQLKLNSASNLAADAVYMFDILVHSGDSVNFQHSANATLKVLRVQEIVGGVQ